MNVLAFDPSSRSTGYALMRLSGEIDPLEVGCLRRPEGWPSWLRVRCIHGDVRRLLERLSGKFERIVVEVPGSAQAGRMRSEFGTSGVYAASVGAVLAESWRVGCPVVTVASDHWTRGGAGRGRRKGERLMALELVSRYKREDDRGGDAGDAIMLGCWYAMRCGSEENGSCTLHFPPLAMRAGMAYSESNLECPDPASGPRPVRRSRAR